MMFKLLFISAILVNLSLTCDVPTCDGLEAGTFIPVISNCRDYRICLEDGTPSEAVLSCGENEHFFNATCIRDTDDWRCQPECLPVSCSGECEKDLDVLANPDDCNAYSVCVGGEPTSQACPDDTPYFDAVLKECSDSPFNCCYNNFTYCDQPFVEIPDPNDCSSFFLCLYEGVPTSDDRFSCDDGEEYLDGECVIDKDGSCVS